MPKAPPQQPAEPVASDRAPRLFSAVLTVEAVAGVGTTEKTGAGRWRLNSGAEMTTVVYGLNPDRFGYSSPIRCVLDLAKTKFDAKKIPCLWAHSTWSLIGNWTNPTIEDDGLYADATIYKPRTDAEAAVMPDAVRVNAYLEQDHPWQASIGAQPKDGIAGYELIPAGKTVTVNGVQFSGDGEYPLYVMRKPMVFEASVVLWGADTNTGRVAAALLNPTVHASTPEASVPAKDLPMKFCAVTAAFIASLLASHPGQEAAILATLGGVKEDSDEGSVRASVKDAVLAAEMQALKTENAALKAAKPAPIVAPATGVAVAPAVEAKKVPPVGGSDEAAAPATVLEGMRALLAEGSTLKGWALRAEALKRWPNAERR